MVVIPEWALKYKEKNMQITKNGNNYYLYRIGGKWNPVKKKTKKITEEYLGKITQTGVIPPKSRLTSLNKDDKVLRNLQILKELEIGKEKLFLSEKYKISTKTIENIQERFKKNGLSGLIHTRKTKTNEIIKISSKTELNIIGELIENPNSNSKEIKKLTGINTSINEIDKFIIPIKNKLNVKKKLHFYLKIE